MPPYPIEYDQVQQIAAQLSRLAKTLQSLPKAEGTTLRTGAPARSIVTSLKSVNATLETAAKNNKLTPAGFAAIGRNFEKIGATLQAVGAPKSSSRTTRRRTTRR